MTKFTFSWMWYNFANRSSPFLVNVKLIFHFINEKLRSRVWCYSRSTWKFMTAISRKVSLVHYPIRCPALLSTTWEESTIQTTVRKFPLIHTNFDARWVLTPICHRLRDKSRSAKSCASNINCADPGRQAGRHVLPLGQDNKYSLTIRWSLKPKISLLV